MGRTRRYVRLDCERILARRQRVEILYRLGSGPKRILATLQAEVPHLINCQTAPLAVVQADLDFIRDKWAADIRRDLVAGRGDPLFADLPDARPSRAGAPHPTSLARFGG